MEIHNKNLAKSKWLFVKKFGISGVVGFIDGMMSDNYYSIAMVIEL